MGERLEITDLRTAPERTYLVEDRAFHSRVQFVISTTPVIPIDHHCAARVMTAFISHLAGYPFDDVRCYLVVQPLGLPLDQVVTQYEVRIGSDPIVGTITLSASFDDAMDGDPPDWKRSDCGKAEALRFGGALQLWLNLNLPLSS